MNSENPIVFLRCADTVPVTYSPQNCKKLVSATITKIIVDKERDHRVIIKHIGRAQQVKDGTTSWKQVQTW